MVKTILVSLMKKPIMVFLGYSLTSHAYRVCNKRLMTVEESVHIVFDETNNVE